MQNYLCNDCGKKFTKRRSWMAHVTRHKQRKKGIRFPCDVCGIIFLDKKSVEIHKRKVHLNDFQYCCEQCGRAFVCVSHLNRHLRSTHEERIIMWYSCQYEGCNQKFKSKSNLNYHILNHENRTYSCESCNKIFQHPYRLKVHNRKYHENRPKRLFQCDLCDVQVTTKVSLLHHTRTHTGERPFVCEHCGQNFTTNQQLKTHTVVHTKEKPFACSFCSKRFTQRGTLGIHIKTSHN